MIVVGAKGFAKELLEVLIQLNKIKNLAFFDNVTKDVPKLLYNKFPILTSEEEVKIHFKNIDNKFALGIGEPQNRVVLTTLFQKLGGSLESIISSKATIGSFNNQIGIGSTIMTGTIITNDVQIGEGCLVNLNSTIGHDTIIGNFCELCPGVHISGNVQIGNGCFIGTGAVILPGIKIGANTIIGAGSLVTKNIPENSVAFGNPARIQPNKK